MRRRAKRNADGLISDCGKPVSVRDRPQTSSDCNSNGLPDHICTAGLLMCPAVTGQFSEREETDMGTVCRGSGWGAEPVGSFENGTIYSGSGWGKTAIGGYANGIIYRGSGWSREAVGSYKNGRIYRGTGWSSTEIGEYKAGSIYRGTGWSATLIGTYREDYDGGAAAAAFLLLAPEFT